MRARDVMSRPVVSVDTRTGVREAAAVLAEHPFSALPVVDDGGGVVGIFSESDALRIEPGQDRLVTEVMTSPVEVVGPATDVRVIAERMLAGHLRNLPVVEEGLLIGVVTKHDLIRTVVRDDDVVKAELRHLLDDYAGSRRRWSLEVTNGVTTIEGDFADIAERDVIGALARTVPGVCSVELIATEPTPLTWDD